jgi:CRISPR-associated endonuclease/helicase Cas3
LREPDCATDQLIGAMLAATAPVAARPLQCAVDALFTDAAGPALLIIEAPMGEGKTEAAFLAYLRLQQRNRHRGLYIGLPTQATGNAMFERTLTFLGAFASGIRLDIQLAHGGAILNETAARLRGIWGDARDEDVSSAAWFSQRKRALLSPYGVGTVDHALLAAMNVKHHFVRLWGLADKVVVLDEVHAYDTYTGGLIESLLRWLRALDCSVVLMSATLPLAKRDALLRAWGASGAVPQLAYPRAMLAVGATLDGRSFAARPQAPVRVHGLAEDIETLAAEALRALEHGGCGAVIVNTVDRAQRLAVRVLELGLAADAVIVFHARFPAEQRRELERRVLDRFGAPGTGRRPGRALLIATQVAEQSLDIDFDFLFSDLAPVDLLLQRAGRLHRHLRPERPAGHREATLTIAGLVSDRLPELIQTAWAYVYDPYLMLVTWAVLRNERNWQLPADIDRLVQLVYGHDPDLGELDADQLRQIDELARARYRARAIHSAQLADNIALDVAAEPATAYANKPQGAAEDDLRGLRNRTRLDDGQTIAVVPVCAHADGTWRCAPGHTGFDPNRAVDDATARVLFARQVKVSRRDLVRELAARPVPVAFASHPLLGNLHALELRDGATRFGSLEVRLDTLLGLVYSTNSTKESA